MVNEIEIATIKSLEGGARLVALAKLVGDQNANFEITQLGELGELEPYRRFINDNKTVWNALRTIPLNLIASAYVKDIKAAYASLLTLCDGPIHWNGESGEPIEGLSIPNAIPLIQSCEFVGHDISLADIPTLISENRTQLLSRHIKAVATKICAPHNIKLSDLYYACFAVDVRSLQTREQFFFAMPFFHLAAMTTDDEELPDGLDRIAARNRYNSWPELQKDLSQKFGITPQSWIEASEVMNIDMANDPLYSMSMPILRRLVRRFKLEQLSQRKITRALVRVTV